MLITLWFLAIYLYALLARWDGLSDTHNRQQN